MTDTDRGTMVEVNTVVLGDELAPGQSSVTNLLTYPGLLVNAGEITGWTSSNLTISGASGEPTVTPTVDTENALLVSPAWPVTAGQTYAVSIGVGSEQVNVALVFSSGEETSTLSAGRVQVIATATQTGTAWLELRWPGRAVTAGYGAGAYGADDYGG